MVFYKEWLILIGFWKLFLSPGWVAQLVRASSQYTKVKGSIPRQGTYKNQPI